MPTALPAAALNDLVPMKAFEVMAMIAAHPIGFTHLHALELRDIVFKATNFDA